MIKVRDFKGSINKNQVNINHSCGHHHDYNLFFGFWTFVSHDSCTCSMDQWPFQGSIHWKYRPYKAHVKEGYGSGDYTPNFHGQTYDTVFWSWNMLQYLHPFTYDTVPSSILDPSSIYIWYSTFILGSWNFHWNIPHASQWHVTNHHGGPVQCDLEVGDGLIMNSRSIPSCLPNLAADSKAWVINQFLAKSLVG